MTAILLLQLTQNFNATNFDEGSILGRKSLPPCQQLKHVFTGPKETQSFFPSHRNHADLSIRAVLGNWPGMRPIIWVLYESDAIV